MRVPILFFVFLAVRAAVAAPPWEDPSVNAENRLEARTYLPLPEPFVKSLAGEWEFAWEGNSDGKIATSDPAKIETPFRINVPSCVELKGWGVPHYTNIRYPFPNTPPTINPQYNPTMLYRRHFSVSESWSCRRVVLRFEGVASCAEIWLNGKRVGYFEDARLPSEFDVTPYLSFTSPANDSNLLEVRVRKWCDGSYLEDQDMIRYAGIFRDVKLLAEPKDGIRDVVVTTTPDKDYRVWTVRIDGGDNPIEFSVEKPRLWSPEDPYLHETGIVRNGDRRRIRYGIRDCRVENGLLLFNGRPIKWKGVNRHEMSPETGYTLSYEEMVEDVKLIKQANFNCLRMSHYPNDPRMYDLCDEYGLLVCAEANIESHGSGYVGGGLANEDAWVQAHVERNVRNVKTYRNHPSVALWSFGNEAGAGKAFERAYAEVRRIDPRTPVHTLGLRRRNESCPKEADFSASDVTSGMYIFLDELKAFAENPKPHWLCEYECAMGNGMGNLRDYWDVFYSSDKLSGGCIWDWIDQAVWIGTDRRNEQGERIRYLGYGGDHDEWPNDGPYCANGLVDALRTPSAKLNEAKHVQQPVEVVADDAAAGTAEFWNRYEFTFADDVLDGVWELSADGVKVDGGTLVVPHVAPRQKGMIKLPKPSAALDPAKEHFYRVSFRLKRDVKWANRGFEQAWNQLKYGPKPAAGRIANVTTAHEVAETADGVRVVSKGLEAFFSRKTGTLSRLMMGGKRIVEDKEGIVHGPRLQVERAFTDSDTWMRVPFIKSGLTQLSFHPRTMLVETAGGEVSVTCPVRITGAKSGGFEYVAKWTFRKDGTIRVINEMTPFGNVPALPRVGVFMRLNGSLENLEYYGRGPWENMIDRSSGCDIARWKSTVTEQYVAYIRPQDCGGKTDVRWVELTDPKDGRGVRFTALDKPFFLQALHFTHDDLDQSRHRPGAETISQADEPRRFQRLVPREEVCLSLDCRQTGLGCNNCGPMPLAKYRFPVEKTRWGYDLKAVESN